MTCEHLRELEAAIVAAGFEETYRGAAWSENCREWVYFDCVLSIDAIRKSFDLADCVKDHAHLGTHDGQESGLVCEIHHDGLMAITRSRVRPPGGTVRSEPAARSKRRSRGSRGSRTAGTPPRPPRRRPPPARRIHDRGIPRNRNGRSMFTEVFPILVTTDLARSLAFYRDVLGGTVTHEIEGPDGSTAYVGLDIGGAHMGIGVDPRDGSARPVRLWVHADDCDAALERVRASGAAIVEGPTDQPTGDRVARVRDPDGNEIVIGQRGGGPRGRLQSVGRLLMSPEPETYTRPEYERRFVVAPGAAWRDGVEPHAKRFEDLYVRHTRLRLRTLTDLHTGREFIKLTKKLESASPYVQRIGSIPLSPMEYEFLAGLEGDRLAKTRYYHFHRGEVFSVDVFEGELAGLVTCEVEAGSLDALMRIEPPDYVAIEVTENPYFTGGNLCRTSRGELMRRLATLGVPLAGTSAR